MLNLSGVDKITWIRLVTLFIALVNQVSISIFSFEILPFNNEEIYEFISIVVTIAATTWATWKNNSLTKEAQMTDEHLKRLKEED